MDNRIDPYETRRAAQMIFEEQVKALASSEQPGFSDWNFDMRAKSVTALTGLNWVVFKVACAELAIKTRQERLNEQTRYFREWTVAQATPVQIIATPVADVVGRFLSNGMGTPSLIDCIASEEEWSAVSRVDPSVGSWEDVNRHQQERIAEIRRRNEELEARLAAERKAARKSKKA